MNYKIEDLSLEEKIGQMLMIGIEGKQITSRTEKLILENKIGGIILYKKNFDSYEEMINLIKELKKLNKTNKIPLFISIDQEGGRVNRMPKEILNLPSPNLIASKLGKEGIKESTQITSEILKKSGFNMNFAPVLDLKKIENKVIGDRSFGKSPKTVSELGQEQINIFKQNKILPVAKHFPGHGATDKDSHFQLPTINTNIQILEQEDMKPFEEVIKNGAEGILVGHLRLKHVTGILPCSLSRRFIIKYLRKKYHYKGLVISDDLKMMAIKYRYGTTRAVIKSIKAGCDITIFRFNQKQEEKTIRKLNELIKKGYFNLYRINTSVNRILKMKEKYCFRDAEKNEILNIEYINKKIEDIRQKIM